MPKEISLFPQHWPVPQDLSEPPVQLTTVNVLLVVAFIVTLVVELKIKALLPNLEPSIGKQ